LTICNKTPERMTVAVVYIASNPSFTSKGWWRLEACGGCKKVLTAQETTDPNNVFYRAEGSEGSVIQGSDRFCVNGSSAFKMDGKTRNCSDKRGFLLLEKINVNNWTTNITGKSSSGKVCID